MRIAIYGTGGAGGYFGARLAQAGEDVVFIARGEHLRAMRERGLRIETDAGELVIEPVRATDDPAQAGGHADLVLLGVKTWQVGDAALAMRPLVGPDSVVLPLQNGVDAPSQLAAVLGRGPVLVGLCGTFSWVVGPGRIRSLGNKNFIRFAEPDSRPSERTERLRRMFERAGVDADVPVDVHKALWNKFLLVASFGGVGALTRAPIDVLRSMPETRRLLERCVAELHAVGRARGIALDDSAVADTLRFLDGLATGVTTSLQRDISDGKPSELEAWNGAAVRLGSQSGVPTPVHEVIYHSLLPLERRARGTLAFPA
jgi:2-dehydropantoate 2-reductase